MEQPVIADKKPAVLKLEPGTYAWCQCGLSKRQPYCDGGHQGTSFTPFMLTVEESGSIALCNCKYTQNPPFCDGAHARL